MGGRALRVAHSGNLLYSKRLVPLTAPNGPCACALPAHDTVDLGQSPIPRKCLICQVLSFQDSPL